jgi:hypothetical protein
MSRFHHEPEQSAHGSSSVSLRSPAPIPIDTAIAAVPLYGDMSVIHYSDSDDNGEEGDGEEPAAMLNKSTPQLNKSTTQASQRSNWDDAKAAENWLASNEELPALPPQGKSASADLRHRHPSSSTVNDAKGTFCESIAGTFVRPTPKRKVLKPIPALK